MTITNDIGPFALTPLWVLERLVTIDQPEALRLYVALSKWTAGNNRTCHPSRATIASYIGCSSKTVTRYTAALESIGALTVRHRKTDDDEYTSNVYRIHTSLPGDTDDPTPPPADVPTPSPVDVPTPRVTDVPQSNTQFEPDPTEADKHTAPSQAMAAGGSDDPEAFELFWVTYKRTGPKKKARDCWGRATRKDSAENIQAGLEHWVRYWETPGAARMKWPQGWLAEERWRDIPPAIQRDNTKHTRTMAVLDNARREAANPALEAMYPEQSKAIES